MMKNTEDKMLEIT